MGSVRQIVFGILPDGQSHATYSWPMIEDGNAEGKLITCAHCPKERTNVYRSNQDQVFLGTKEVNYTIKTFANEYGYDGYDPISAEFITNRIDPSLLADEISDAKRFLKISFFDVNPIEENVDLYFCKDESNPLINSLSWEEIQGSAAKSRATFGHGLARWVNIRGVFTGGKTKNPIFGPFVLSYYRLYNRGGEELK